MKQKIGITSTINTRAGMAILVTGGNLLVKKKTKLLHNRKMAHLLVIHKKTNT